MNVCLRGALVVFLWLVVVLALGCEKSGSSSSDDDDDAASDGDGVVGDDDDDLSPTDGDSPDDDDDDDDVTEDGDDDPTDGDDDPTDGDNDPTDGDDDPTDGDEDPVDGDDDPTDGDDDPTDGDDDPTDGDEETCDGCLIAGTCVPSGQENPDSACAFCDPERDASGWSLKLQGTECRAVAGVCDIVEVCDGVSNDCPADEKAMTECRAVAGVCDVAEVCDGVNNDCPADEKATTECRAAAGVCDVAEVCDGVSNDCPVDEKATTECRGAVGVCDVAEVCDGVSNDCPADEKATTECRAVAGVCDVAEVCDGVSNDCPVDNKATTECRAVGGVCDVAEVCDGVSNDCPVDEKATTECRAVAGVCDVSEVCDGVSNDCPVDEKATTECRAVAGVCDVAEVCDGVSNDCPVDEKATTECRGAGGVCDVAEVCDGVSNDCPADEKATTECRSAAGVCDVAEVCDGVSNDCPADGKATTECRAVAGVCDVAEVCDGVNNDCPIDLKLGGETLCRPAVGVCDWDEVCNGMTDACPADGFLVFGATCEGTNQCDGEGNCLDCVDAFGCEDLSFGERAEACTERVCGADNLCAFNDAPTGTGCGSDDQCEDGICTDCTDASGCLDLSFGERAEACTERVCGADNLCAFNDAPTGAGCGSDDQCEDGICADCVDDGGCADYADDGNACTDKACDNHACGNVNDDTNPCDLGHACTDDHCVDGTCLVETITTGCLIGGVCVDEGASQDADGCIACDPIASKIEWTNMNGTACAVTDDGNPCTDNVCADGSCIVQNDDTNTCADEIGCTATSCNGGSCVISGTNAGCYIDNACYDQNVRKAATGNDSCRACNQATTWNAWTTLTSGTCDDGNACTYNDVCTSGGICAGTAYSCDSPHALACKGDGTCECDNPNMNEDCSACKEGYASYPDCFEIGSFVPITAGSFWMGSPGGTCPEGYPGSCTSELGRDSDETLHYVQLTYDFELSRYEITQGEFAALMGWNPSDYFADCGDNCPVETVSWYDTLAYANQLSLDQGLTPCYVLSNVGCEYGGNVGSDYMGCFDGDATYGGIYSATVALNGATKPQECEGYRLPTEAEWEYAIRAGSNTAFYPSDGNNGTITNTGTSPVDPNLTQIAWYGGNSSPYETKPVGGKEANAWGLYDMSGNVWEWSWNWYQSDYQNDVATDPVSPPALGAYRVLRGSDWGGPAHACRSASRGLSMPDYRNANIGFRLVRSQFGPCSPNPCTGPHALACDSDGTCICDTGYGGDLCDTCAQGYMGYPNCVPEPTFVPITAGGFWMGSPSGCLGPDGYPGSCTSESGRGSNEALHYVHLSYDFEMSQYEITQGDYTALMGWNPSHFGPNGSGTDCGDDCPVEMVSWLDAMAFANELSIIHGLTPCMVPTSVFCTDGTNAGADYMQCMNSTRKGIRSGFVALADGASLPQQCEGYRLPTEAEWEYAIRAGTTTALYNGAITTINAGLIGWYDPYAGSTPHPVGGKEPNAWGLYDMSGNVWELVWDLYVETYQAGSFASPLVDPVQLPTVPASFMVRRGGSWLQAIQYTRSANRGHIGGMGPTNEDGFRLVRSLLGPCSPDPCFGHGTCNSSDSTCICDNEHMTADCSACAEGYWNYPACTPEGTFPDGYCANHSCWSVPPTNLTACYNASSSIACPGTAGSETCRTTNFCGQDAQYADNTRTFTCYNADGSVQTPCDGTADADEVVTDSLIGLMWQRTWTTNTTWQEALDYCDTLTYGGYDDWHLPNPHELLSLADYGLYNPALDTTVFPGTSTQYFWSSSTLATSSGSAWYVGLNGGRALNATKTTTYNARCVRSEPVEGGTGMFDPFVFSIVDGDQVATDLVSGLVWQTFYVGAKTWQQALATCEGSTYAGRSDWRLPNVSELVSLVNYERSSPASVFSTMPSTDFWSSTTRASSLSSAWQVGFYNGGMNSVSKTTSMNVRCVADGP